ncbi:indolethylamine N-methyltransferase-like isoform X2 [Ascaphus truei]|uniref:indolethylamine N-methyltransferase-like isoform X2 n=1 Tax=Ascaphus truei TaxID=8439 RepID=UPI003F595EDF
MEFTGGETYQSNFDPKAYLATFCSFGTGRDGTLNFRLQKCLKTFSSGGIGGHTLIDIGTGPSIYQLFSACESFKQIIATDFTERNRQELERWLKKEPGAFDWSVAVKAVCELEGNREEWQVKEDKVRRAVKQIVKWDVTKDNPLEPVVLPQVDCVLSLWCLSSISRDKEAYRSNLRKFASLLNIGGHLLLFVGFNISHYMIGEHKFFMLSYDEHFLREALRDAGYVIENMDVLPSKRNTVISDYEHAVYVIARKEKEV